jgi:hypothetical protein
MRSKGALSVFLARTPLQFLICNEAQQQFGISPNQSTLLLFTDFTPSLSQVNNNLNANQWLRVHRVFGAVAKKNGPMVLLQKAVGLLRLYWLTVRYKQVDTLFVGHIDDVWMRFFVRRVKAKNTVLLEDGIATLRIAARRYGSSVNGPFPLHQNKPGKGFFRNNIFEERVLGNQNVTFRSLTFFTAYNSIEVSAHDRIVENGFLCLKEQAVKNQVPVNEVWFIGQPLVERGIITKEELIALLAKVKNRWGSTYEYFYVIHRSERPPQYLGEVGYKTISFDNPIEVVLTQLQSLPRVIGSVNSAALINTSKLLSETETKFFYCQLSQSFYSSRPDSKRILEYYQTHTSMECISL